MHGSHSIPCQVCFHSTNQRYVSFTGIFSRKPQELPFEVLNLERPQTYTIGFGVQRDTEIIRENLGFFNYKNKNGEIKIYLVRIERKSQNPCPATAQISPDQNDRRLILCMQHNHKVRPFNVDVPLLRQTLTEKTLRKTVCSYTPRGIYMEEIVKVSRWFTQYYQRRHKKYM
eukprot:XP_016657093.1 PREDICTED: uncharacterized protein LOC100570948 isoform X1 [Acyrthosiphon pisum]